jgi:hypothetical protein
MSAKGRNLLRVGLAVAFLVGAVLACGPTPGAEAITVVITSPTSGSTLAVGQEVLIDSTTTAEAGVAWVELAVDGEVVRRDLPPEGNPTTFRVSQAWTPMAEGPVRVSIVACDVAGNVSQAALVTLQVMASGAAVPTVEAGPTSVPGPTAPPTGPTEEPPPPVTTEAGCTLDSQYVADVTVPDGTVMTPGAGFVKTWRVRNSGTCDWEAGFQLIFVSGAQMGGPASVPLPAVPAGGQTEVSVNLVAPSAYGTHKGTWRMRTSDGTMFGTNLTVLIVVPAPATATPLPTAVPTSLPTTGAVATQRVMAGTGLRPGKRGSATANCPAGSIVVGGFDVNEEEMGAIVAYAQIKSGNGWRLSAINVGSDLAYYFEVYAVCLSNAPGASVTSVDAQVTVPAGEVRKVAATCPAGSRVTSGGWVTPEDGRMDVNASQMLGNGWEVAARNNGDLSGLLQAQAVCLAGGDVVIQGGSRTEVSVERMKGSAHAACEPGALVVGSGFVMWEDLHIASSMPRPDREEWEVVVDNPSESARLLIVHSVCLSLP